MNRALLALLLATSVVAVAQDTKAKPAADKKAETAKKPAAAPAPAPAKAATAPAKAVAGATALVANKDSKTYHRADCRTVAKMKETNRTSFASAAEADKAGYKPCKVCKP